MNDEENKGFTSFALAFISATYNFPKKEISVTTEWFKSLKLDYIATTRMMVVEGKTFRHKQSGKYETAHLWTPFRVIALMLRRIYGRADGRFYNFGWIPLLYCVAMKGSIFNWVDIVSMNLAKCIKATQEGLQQRKSEFYMSSFLVDCILYRHRFEKLNCIWKGGKAPIYSAYQILGAHKYHNHYKMICEEFPIPLY